MSIIKIINTAFQLMLKFSTLLHGSVTVCLLKTSFSFCLEELNEKVLMALILTCGLNFQPSLYWSNHFVHFLIKKSKTFLLECKDKCLMTFLIEKFKEVNRY